MTDIGRLKIERNIATVFCALLVTAIPLANILMIFGGSYENLYPSLAWCLSLVVVFVGIILYPPSLSKTHQFVFFIVAFLCIFLIITNSFIYLFFDEVIIDGYEESFIVRGVLQTCTKGLTLLLIIYYVNRLNAKDIRFVFSFYFWVVLISCIGSYLLYHYLGVRIERFIYYNQGRFSGFHNELVYFSFSIIVISVYLTRYSHLLLKTVSIIFAIYASFFLLKSNISVVFFGVIGLAVLVVFANSRYFFLVLVYSSILLFSSFFYLWPDLVSNLESLVSIFPRSANISTDLTPERVASDPILIRLSVLHSSLNHFFNSSYFMGVGVGSSKYLVSAENMFVDKISAMGFPAGLADLGIIFIVMLVTLVNLVSKLFGGRVKPSFFIVAVILMSFYTLALHAGYLNFGLLVFMFMAIRYAYIEQDLRSASL